LFSETNIARVAKNGTIPPHRKHLENSIAYLLIIVYFDDVTPTSQFTFIAEMKQAIVSAWQQLSQAFIDKSINKWRRRLECGMGAISNICLNN